MPELPNPLVADGSHRRCHTDGTVRRTAESIATNKHCQHVREYVQMSDSHLPVRPLWNCAVDGMSWPCEFARKQIQTAITSDLSVYMGHVMLMAARDLGIENSPSRLYRHFLAWTTDNKGPCGRCGRAGHAALPGLPPRLFPCDFKKEQARG